MRDASLEDRAKAVIARIERLPSPSVVAVRLLQATQSSETAVRDIVGIVSQDPAIAARVLSLCRRCHRGLSVEVDSVERAVVLLGFDEIRAAALSVELASLLGDGEPDDLGDRLRRRSVVVASLARIAADRLPALDRIEPATAFLAGLLHDLGHLALHAAIPEALDRIAESASLGDTDFDATLRRVVGIDGPATGERLAARWGLPSSLRRTIGPGGHDERVLAGEGQRLERLVALADLVARRHGLGSIGRRPTEAAVRTLESSLDLEVDALDALLPEAVDLAARSAELLGLDREPTETMLVRSLAEANVELDRMRRRVVVASNDPRGTVDGVAGFLSAVDGTSGVDGIRTAILDDLRRRDPAARIALAWWEEDEGWRLDAGNTTRSIEGGIVEQVRTAVGEAVEVQVLGSVSEGLVIATSTPVEVGSELVATWCSCWRSALRIERLEDRVVGRASVRAEAVERLRDEAVRDADAAMAEIAAGAAHEMNNPLTVISGRAQLLRGRSGDPLVEDAITEIIDAGRKVAGIVAGLHRHASAASLDREAMDGSTLVLRAAAEAQKLVRGLGPVDVVDDAGAVPLDVDVRRITDVVVEACRNAHEADDAARIRIRTSSDATDGRWTLQVEDDGPGFGREALDHAFEPFFSLKPAGRRAGLGLAVVRRIVEAHDGVVVVRNRSEGGGCLVVSLPIRHSRTVGSAA